jgi:2'-5' RNA ligase
MSKFYYRMKRKIFISINIPDKIKNRLIKATEKWQDLPVKWVKEANLHVTLFFLGYIDDETTQKVCRLVSETTAQSDIFDLEFNRIEIGPTPEKQQLIWATGEPNQELLGLYEQIEKQLGIFSSSKKKFRPHITLGRIRHRQWEALENKPEISEKFPLVLTVESVEVMASRFGGGENEYAIIETCPLK